MKKNVFLPVITYLIIISASQNCFSQDTLLYDKDWQPASPTNAEFFRVQKQTGPNQWAISDYFYKTKQVQMTGVFSSLKSETKHGYFEWFHPNGKLKHKGYYEYGKQIGEPVH